MNYERVSLNITNHRVLDLLYEMKMYLEHIHESCKVINFYLECDGQIVEDYEYLENYHMINYIISYIPVHQDDGFAFYKKKCQGFTKEEVRVFGITDDAKLIYYAYNGNTIAALNFKSLTYIDEKYQCFEATPMSIMFEIPNYKNQEPLKKLMKQWAEIGTEFYETCVDVEEYDGYVSYLVEPTYHMNRTELTYMIDLYNQLVDLMKQYKGRMISVQPLLVSYHLSADLVIKIEKNSFGMWFSDPFFKPILN